MSIFVIYIRWLLGNSVGLHWVGLAMPICNVGKTKLDDGTVKGEKKKKKRTIECDKNTAICDIGIIQCNDGTIKYEKKKLEYHQM